MTGLKLLYSKAKSQQLNVENPPIFKGGLKANSSFLKVTINIFFLSDLCVLRG